MDDSFLARGFAAGSCCCCRRCSAARYRRGDTDIAGGVWRARKGCRAGCFGFLSLFFFLAFVLAFFSLFLILLAFFFFAFLFPLACLLGYFFVFFTVILFRVTQVNFSTGIKGQGCRQGRDRSNVGVVINIIIGILGRLMRHHVVVVGLDTENLFVFLGKQRCLLLGDCLFGGLQNGNFQLEANVLV